MELCDSVDNDCDNLVDESPLLPSECEVSPGCPGIVAGCAGGVVCDRFVDACEDTDEDCDGHVDEGNLFCEDCRGASFGGHDYLFCRKLRNWTDAATWCGGRGMTLARIESSGENEFVLDTLESIDGFVAFDWWIGLRDVVSDGSASRSGVPLGAGRPEWLGSL